jgi:hypothetical protein
VEGPIELISATIFESNILLSQFMKFVWRPNKDILLDNNLFFGSTDHSVAKFADRPASPKLPASVSAGPQRQPEANICSATRTAKEGRGRREPRGDYAAQRNEMDAGSNVRLRHAHGEGVARARSVSSLWIDLLVPEWEGGMKWRVIVELGGAEGAVQLHEVSAGRMLGGNIGVDDDGRKNDPGRFNAISAPRRGFRKQAVDLPCFNTADGFKWKLSGLGSIRNWISRLSLDASPSMLDSVSVRANSAPGVRHARLEAGSKR